MASPRRPTCFLAGERVALRAPEPEDVALVTKWVNDREVTEFMFTGQRPMGQPQVLQDLQRLIANSENVVFLIEDRKSEQPIGLAGLYDCQATARKAEFRILIGERSVWNQGCGTEVTELIVFYGFDRLNLNRIWLGITAENGRGIRAYEKAGFRQEGVLRQDIYRNSRYYDTIRMSVLREEYYSVLYKQHANRFAASHHRKQTMSRNRPR